MSHSKFKLFYYFSNVIVDLFFLLILLVASFANLSQSEEVKSVHTIIIIILLLMLTSLILLRLYISSHKQKFTKTSLKKIPGPNNNFNIFQIYIFPTNFMEKEKILILEVIDTQKDNKLINLVTEELNFLFHISNYKNTLFFFREVFYIVFFQTFLLKFFPKSYSAFSISAILVFLLSLFFKAYVIRESFNRLLNALLYIYEISIKRFSYFYMHPILLNMLNIYKHEGISSLILKAFRELFPGYRS